MMLMRDLLNPKILGAIYGLIVGLILILEGPLEAFLVALLIFAGWVVGKIVSREIDFGYIAEMFTGRRERIR